MRISPYGGVLVMVVIVSVVCATVLFHMRFVYGALVLAA